MRLTTNCCGEKQTLRCCERCWVYRGRTQMRITAISKEVSISRRGQNADLAFIRDIKDTYAYINRQQHHRDIPFEPYETRILPLWFSCYRIKAPWITGARQSWRSVGCCTEMQSGGCCDKEGGRGCVGCCDYWDHVIPGRPISSTKIS